MRGPLESVRGPTSSRARQRLTLCLSARICVAGRVSTFQVGPQCSWLLPSSFDWRTVSLGLHDDSSSRRWVTLASGRPAVLLLVQRRQTVSVSLSCTHPARACVPCLCVVQAKTLRPCARISYEAERERECSIEAAFVNTRFRHVEPNRTLFFFVAHRCCRRSILLSWEVST